MSAVLESPRETGPDLSDSDALFEIVDGQRVEKLMSKSSTWVAGRLDQSLGAFATQHALGTVIPEALFILDPDPDNLLQRRPDVAFLSAEKWPVGRMPDHEGEWDIIPDLAVEILSPTNIFEDMLEKLDEYFRHGVQEVWLVSPQQRLVQVYHSLVDVSAFARRSSLQTDLLPGWSIEIDVLMPAAARSTELP